MNILFYDSDIIVCEKPAGVISEGKGENTMPALLSRRLCESGEANTEVFVVHRLDKETVGVMVFARNKASAAALSQAIVDGKLEKRYYAVVHGTPSKSADTLTDLLFFDRKRGKSFVVGRERAGVKRAVLDYRLVESKNGLSLLDIQLHTGRTHQIRAQLSSRGLPLAGDRRYGAPKDTPHALALVAYKLRFPHPKTKKPLEFTAEIPNSFSVTSLTDKSR